MPLDQIDKKILSALQQDGRLSNQDLSVKVGLSASPCLRRMKQLEQDGYISNYVALVEPAALGLDITAFARVSLDRQESGQLDAFERAVAAWPEVMECYLMTGDSDYQLRVVTRSLSDYERFLRERLTRAPGVAKIQSSFAFRPVVRRTALPLD